MENIPKKEKLTLQFVLKIAKKECMKIIYPNSMTPKRIKKLLQTGTALADIQFCGKNFMHTVLANTLNFIV